MQAIRQSGYHFPGGRVIVNLSPADLPKVGATYDLPIALGVLAAASNDRLKFDDFVCVGELSLQGQVRPVRAALGATVIAQQERKSCLLSSDSVLAAPQGARIAGVSSLRDAVQIAQGRREPLSVSEPEIVEAETSDLAEVRDQPLARRALEVAAAGAHHLLFVGPPGAGKTMLARCLPSILPPLDPERQREVASASTVPRLLSGHRTIHLPWLPSSVAAPGCRPQGKCPRRTTVCSSSMNLGSFRSMCSTRCASR